MSKTLKEKFREQINKLVPELFVCRNCRNSDEKCNWCLGGKKKDDFAPLVPQLQHVLLALKKAFEGHSDTYAVNTEGNLLGLHHYTDDYLSAFKSEQVGFDLTKDALNQNDAFYWFNYCV